MIKDKFTKEQLNTGYPCGHSLQDVLASECPICYTRKLRKRLNKLLLFVEEVKDRGPDIYSAIVNDLVLRCEEGFNGASDSKTNLQNNQPITSNL